MRKDEGSNDAWVHGLIVMTCLIGGMFLLLTPIGIPLLILGGWALLGKGNG